MKNSIQILHFLRNRKINSSYILNVFFSISILFSIIILPSDKYDLNVIKILILSDFFIKRLTVNNFISLNFCTRLQLTKFQLFIFFIIDGFLYVANNLYIVALFVLFFFEIHILTLNIILFMIIINTAFDKSSRLVNKKGIISFLASSILYITSLFLFDKINAINILFVGLMLYLLMYSLFVKFICLN